MNKEELIKIYSTYLPFGLQARLNHKGLFDLDLEYPDPSYSRWGKINNWQMYDGNLSGSIFISDRMSVDFENIDEIDIALYDLSYFERYFSQLFDNDLDVRTFLNNDFLTIDNQFESLDDMLENYKVEWWPYGVVQLALKHHFNIFGLKEDQFINKATLNK